MIRLQFSLQRAISSEMIAWFSSGHLSHVDCLLPDGRLLGARSDVYKPPGAAAIAAGVQVRPPEYARFIGKAIFTIPTTPVQASAFYAFLNGQIGKPYDRQAIFAFVLNRDWREDDSWICSELQAAALEAAKIVPPLYLAANKITPVALALTASAIAGAIFKV